MGFIGGLDVEYAKTIIRITRQFYKNKTSDIPKYFYYRLTEAFRIITSMWKIKKKKARIKDNQIYLKFVGVY